MRSAARLCIFHCCVLIGLTALGVEFPDGHGLFNRRLGMFIHWGIYSVNGFHEQERMRKRIPRAGGWEGLVRQDKLG